MTARLNELNRAEDKLSREENEAKRNFVSLPSSPADKLSQSPDEISFQLSFRFVCGNSFKILIAIWLCLMVGWNVYTSLNRQNLLPAAQAPALPQLPAVGR